MFKSCLDVLRNNEGISGKKALSTLTHLLVMKLIEPHIGVSIDVELYEFDFSNLEGDLEKFKNNLLHIIKFSNLAKSPEMDFMPIRSFIFLSMIYLHIINRGKRNGFFVCD